MNHEQIANAIRLGTTVQLQLPGVDLQGVRVKILRQSRKTQGLTVEMVEDAQLYKKGATLHVKPYEVEEMQLRPAELSARLTDACCGCIREMEYLVRAGREARQKLAQKILIDLDPNDKAAECVELLVDEVRGGHGIKEDLMAAHAARVLAALKDGHAMTLVLDWVVNDCEDRLKRNHFIGHSSSQFANAIDEERAGCARNFAELCQRHSAHIKVYRAEMEVL